MEFLRFIVVTGCVVVMFSYLIMTADYFVLKERISNFDGELKNHEDKYSAAQAEISKLQNIIYEHDKSCTDYIDNHCKKIEKIIDNIRSDIEKNNFMNEKFEQCADNHIKEIASANSQLKILSDTTGALLNEIHERNKQWSPNEVNLFLNEEMKRHKKEVHDLKTKWNKIIEVGQICMFAKEGMTHGQIAKKLGKNKKEIASICWQYNIYIKNNEGIS